MRKYFHIFLGAVLLRNGLSSIQAWIYALIDWSLTLPSVTNVDIGSNVVDVEMAVDVSPFFPLSIDTQKKSVSLRAVLREIPFDTKLIAAVTKSA